MTKEANRQKREVWEGKRSKTASGLKRKDLMKNKDGKVVSKKQHKRGQELYRMMKKEGRLADPFKKRSSSTSRSKTPKRSKKSRSNKKRSRSNRRR